MFSNTKSSKLPVFKRSSKTAFVISDKLIDMILSTKESNCCEKSENKSYSENGSLRYQDYGNLTFTILNKQLNDKGVDISYGDIIGYSDRESNLKYFEVFDDGKINSDNAHTQFGYKSYYRTVSCVTVDPDQFNGI
jgi:formylmethanofuran dehydrogenase subunit E